MTVEGKTTCLEVLVKRRGHPYLRVTLDQSPAVVGRDGSAAVRLNSKKVSRNHARLEFSDRGVRIVDSGSRNGFRVDGEATEQARLTPKNTVELADFEFRIRLTQDPRVPPGEPHYYRDDAADDATAAEHARLVKDESDRRMPAAPTRAMENELSEGWAEIEREGEEDTNITRRPIDRRPRVAPDLLAVERSVMNQLQFARSHADLEAAVGDELDEEDADEYVRPDLEPLLKTLHGETNQLLPQAQDVDVAVEVIFAVGASIEDTALLAPGERYWWGGKPGRLRERFLIPRENRFPLVTHLQDGAYLVDVPQHPGWKLFRKGKGPPPAHRTGVLIGIEAHRDEQVEVSYGPFTFYVRCVARPPRIDGARRRLAAPDRQALSALVMSTVFHAALMAIPVDPLPTLDTDHNATDRFVEMVAVDLTLELDPPEPEPELPPEPEPEPELVEPLEPLDPEPEPPPITEVKPEVDVSENTTQVRRRRRSRDRVDLKEVEEAPPRQVVLESSPPAGTDAAPQRTRGELSVSNFKVTGMIDHLPTVKIDPAKGPKLRSGAPVLRGERGKDLGVLDKSGQGMSLTPPGRLSKAEVRKVVNENSRDIGRCQARAQKERPDLNGKLVLQWTVLTDGSSTNARVVYDDMGSPEFTNCAKAAVLTWIFPEPRGGSATVSYPFKVQNLNL